MNFDEFLDRAIDKIFTPNNPVMLNVITNIRNGNIHSWDDVEFYVRKWYRVEEKD